MEGFLDEFKMLKEQNVNPRIIISDRAQIVLPFHLLFDKYEEIRLGE